VNGRKTQLMVFDMRHRFAILVSVFASMQQIFQECFATFSFAANDQEFRAMPEIRQEVLGVLRNDVAEVWHSKWSFQQPRVGELQIGMHFFFAFWFEEIIPKNNQSFCASYMPKKTLGRDEPL
jgi:hypothetical protein